MLTTAELEAGLAVIREAPQDAGVLALIVRRPERGMREVLTTGQLDVVEGLVGDNWRVRGSSRTADGAAHPEMQINIMNARVIALLAEERARWPLAGDQLYLDMDLSEAALPPGTRLALGTAVLEITAQPHTGCRQFSARFGVEALAFVSTPLGRALRLRGVNARVVQSGVVQVGAVARKVVASAVGA